VSELTGPQAWARSYLTSRFFMSDAITDDLIERAKGTPGNPVRPAPSRVAREADKVRLIAFIDQLNWRFKLEVVP
jgi:hypothetical protein